MKDAWALSKNPPPIALAVLRDHAATRQVLLLTVARMGPF
jgi:hypothetical protein